MDIVKVLTPEEQELEAQRALAASLGLERTERELELATLRAELAQFDRLCRYRLAERYARLDELRAQLATVQAAKAPEQPAAQRRAEQARERAEQSASEVPEEKEPEPPARFIPSDALRALFRKVALLVHPDHACSDGDRQRRHELMVEANDAYAAGDESRLREILAGYDPSSPPAPAADTTAALAEVLCAIEEARSRLAAIEREIAVIRRGDLYAFMLRVRQAEEEQRDLIAEMADDLDAEIQAAQECLRAEEAW